MSEAKKGQMPKFIPRNFKASFILANQIRIEYEMGKITQEELAAKYKLHRVTISKIINNKIWKEEPIKEVI